MRKGVFQGVFKDKIGPLRDRKSSTWNTLFKKVFNKLDVHAFDLLKNRIELKGPILSLRPPWKTPFLENQRNEPVLRFYKKSSHMPRVVWAEESKNGSDLKSYPVKERPMKSFGRNICPLFTIPAPLFCYLHCLKLPRLGISLYLSPSDLRYDT